MSKGGGKVEREWCRTLKEDLRKGGTSSPEKKGDGRDGGKCGKRGIEVRAVGGAGI